MKRSRCFLRLGRAGTNPDESSEKTQGTSSIIKCVQWTDRHDSMQGVASVPGSGHGSSGPCPMSEQADEKKGYHPVEVEETFPLGFEKKQRRRNLGAKERPKNGSSDPSSPSKERVASDSWKPGKTDEIRTCTVQSGKDGFNHFWPKPDSGALASRHTLFSTTPSLRRAAFRERRHRQHPA